MGIPCRSFVTMCVMSFVHFCLLPCRCLAPAVHPCPHKTFECWWQSSEQCRGSITSAPTSLCNYCHKLVPQCVHHSCVLDGCCISKHTFMLALWLQPSGTASCCLFTVAVRASPLAQSHSSWCSLSQLTACIFHTAATGWCCLCAKSTCQVV